jgi:hypothetical protein
MRYILVLFMLVMGLGVANAQTTAVPADSLSWEITEGLAAANRFTYTLELDGVVQTVTAVTCSQLPAPAVNAQCVTAIPAITPGAHIVRVRATDMVNGTPLMSAFSLPLSFAMAAIPATPVNLNIIRATQ